MHRQQAGGSRHERGHSPGAAAAASVESCRWQSSTEHGCIVAHSAARATSSALRGSSPRRAGPTHPGGAADTRARHATGAGILTCLFIYRYSYVYIWSRDFRITGISESPPAVRNSSYTSVGTGHVPEYEMRYTVRISSTDDSRIME
jgi:hypothetical protein